MKIDREGYSQPDKAWRPGYVYVIDYGDGETFKIGHTANEPDVRLRQIKTGGSVILPMELVMSSYTQTNAARLEELLHMIHDCYHVKGEWFRLDFFSLFHLYEILHLLTGEVNLYSRWFEVIPEDAEEFVRSGAIDRPLWPVFCKEDWDNRFENLFRDLPQSV